MTEKQNFLFKYGLFSLNEQGEEVYNRYIMVQHADLKRLEAERIENFLVYPLLPTENDRVILFARVPEIEYDYHVEIQDSFYYLIANCDGSVCARAENQKRLERVIGKYFRNCKVNWSGITLDK